MSKFVYVPKMGIEIIEVLGKNMYSNINHAIGELIANSYDAGASNVWIKYDDKAHKFSIEDDGSGMSKEYLLETFLFIGERKNEIREKNIMGRKGIGKLACLFVSPEVYIFSKKDNNIEGFIMSLKPERIIQDKDGKEGFGEISEDIRKTEIFVNKTGTKIVMKNIYNPNFSYKSLKSGIKDIFEGISSKIFKVYFNEEIIDLSPRIQTDNILKVIIIGDYDYKFLNIEDESKLEFVNSPIFPKEYKDNLKGWIGIYESLNKEVLKKSGFENWKFNSIKIFSRGKLGQADILNDPKVSKNRIGDRYVSGYIYSDVFEEGAVDMALPNRQGYNSEDERYIIARKKISEWVNNLVSLRAKIKQKTKDVDKAKRFNENSITNKKYIDEFVSKIKFSKNEKDFQQNIDIASAEITKKLKLEIVKKALLISHKTPIDGIAGDDARKMLVSILLLFKKFHFKDSENGEEEDFQKIIIISSMDDYSPSHGDFWKWIFDNMIKNTNNQPGVLLNLFTSDVLTSHSLGIESGMAYAASLFKTILIGEQNSSHANIPEIMKGITNQIIPNLFNFISTENKGEENKIAEIFISLLKEFEINTCREKVISYMHEIKNNISNNWLALKKQYFKID